MKTKAIFGLVAGAAMMAPNVQAVELIDDLYGNPKIPDNAVTDCARLSIIENTSDSGFFSNMAIMDEQGNPVYRFERVGPGRQTTSANIYQSSSSQPGYVATFGGDDPQGRRIAVQTALQSCLDRIPN